MIESNSLVCQGAERRDLVQIESSRWLVAGSITALFVSLAALYARFPGFDVALHIASRLVGERGEVSSEGLVVFSRDLLAGAVLAAVTSGILLVASVRGWRRKIDTFIRQDALHAWKLTTPNSYLVLACATLAGLLVIGIWAQRSVVPVVERLFTKEGPLEYLTFVLEIFGAGMCFLAARHWTISDPPSMRLARGLYAALGLLLLFVAMEEINWGQTVLGFATPEGWSRINYQHETSIHNLASKRTLTAAWKLVSLSFGAGVVAIVASGMRFPRSLVSALAPHPTLVPIALCAAYAGAWLHPELIELLLSIFFAFYGYRIWRAARSRARRAVVLQR